MKRLINKIDHAKQEAWDMATEAAKTDAARQKKLYAIADQLQKALDAALAMERDEIMARNTTDIWDLLNQPIVED